MYHTIGFTEDEIIDLCALIYANEEDCDIDPWPPSLGLYKSVVIALTYMRRNRVQQELAETYKTSQPAISRVSSRITSRLAIALAPFVPTAEDLDPGTQYIYDGTLLPCWSWRGHRELYSGCEDVGATSCSWPDPYSGWPLCLVLDLSATGVRW
jgi:hypothetical protein